MMLIMIGGKARVGKTTLAKILGECFYNKGFSPVYITFASILKEEVERTTGMTKESNSNEYREACQKLGSSKRKEDGDYWVKLLDKKLEEIKVQDVINLETDVKNWHEKVVIVDDCRYMNEVVYGRRKEALQIFISHGTRTIIEQNASWRSHESESLANSIEDGNKNYCELFHYNLKNNKTLIDFVKNVKKLFPEILIGAQDIHSEVLRCVCPVCLARRGGLESIGFNEDFTTQVKKLIDEFDQKFGTSNNPSWIEEEEEEND